LKEAVIHFGRNKHMLWAWNQLFCPQHCGQLQYLRTYSVRFVGVRSYIKRSTSKKEVEEQMTVT
jgi:hypothetical protein